MPGVQGFVKGLKKPFRGLLPYHKLHNEEEEEDLGVPEPRRTSADLEGSAQRFEMEDLNSLPTQESLHCLCKEFSSFSNDTKKQTADAVASKHLHLMLEHFLESKEKVCDELMQAVMFSPECKIDICMERFLRELNGSGSWLFRRREERASAKKKAIKGVEAILTNFGDLKRVKSWLPALATTMVNVVAGQFRKPKKDGSRTYVDQGEKGDILGSLPLKVDLAHRLHRK